MAMGKTMVDIKGITTDYHRILTSEQDFTIGQEAIRLKIASYTSAEYRTLEKGDSISRVVSSNEYILPIVDEDFTRENLYNRIMAEISDFAESIMV